MHRRERLVIGLGGAAAVGVLLAASAQGRAANEVLAAAVLPLGFFSMGSVAAVLRGGHAVGHRLLAVGVLHLLAVVGAAVAAEVGHQPVATLLGAVSALLFVTGFIALLDLLLRFPSGGYAWQWAGRLVPGAATVTGLATAVAVIGSPRAPNVLGLPMPENSMHVESLAPLAGAFTVVLVVPVVGLGLLLARYRRAPEADRRQMTWPIWTTVIIVLGILTTTLVERTLGAAAQSAVFVSAALLFPASFLVGLLRHSEEQDRLAELTASRGRIAQAAAEERRRIERDLHDGAQQQLIALLSQVETARIRSGDGGPREDLDRIAAGIRQAHHDLRALAQGIHPAVLSDHGLAEAVRSALGRIDGEVHLLVDPAVERSRYPEQLELTAYLVVLEGLTNAAKHAPAAPVSVRLEGDPTTLLVRVHDAGPGFTETAGGSGLRGLRDRLAAAGGSLDVRSRPGAGTTVTARLPITAPVADA